MSTTTSNHVVALAADAELIDSFTRHTKLASLELDLLRALASGPGASPASLDRLLVSVIEELEAARVALALIRREGAQ